MSEYTPLKSDIHEIAALEHTIHELKARNAKLVSDLLGVKEDRDAKDDLIRTKQKELDDANDYAEDVHAALVQANEKVRLCVGENNILSQNRDKLLFEYGIAHSFIPADEVSSFLERISLSRLLPPEIPTD